MEEWSFLTAREQAELKLALLYTKDFDHGTSGHLAYTLITKLAHEIVRLRNEDIEEKREYMD